MRRLNLSVRLRENSPVWRLIRNKEEKQFRVKFDKVYYGWFVDTPTNRKAVLVFLREMYDSETGRWVFTEEELAELRQRESPGG